MRPSEYLGLKWQDIDWTRQTVSVVRSVRRLDGRWCFCDTKRSQSRRPIKLQRWIVALLRDVQTKASAQIGRASCREREKISVIGVRVKKKVEMQGCSY